MKTFMTNAQQRGWVCTVLLTIAATLPFAANAKLNVVATTPDLGALAEEIGGNKIDLVTLAKPTEDPHFVDAKPSYIVKLNRADVLIEGGAELEVGWLPALLEGARNTKLEAGKPGRIQASEGISLLEIPSALDRSKGDIHAAGNPHFMTDPMNGKIVAEHIANSLCQLDPKSCDYFKANLKQFEDKLSAKMAEWDTLLAPDKGKPVVTFHNYWIYFAKRFGIPMDIYLEPKPGIPPTPAHLAEVIQKMKADSIKVIAVQPYQNRKTAETVASHTSAVLVDFPSFPGGTPETKTYLGWVDDLVKTLVKAFGEAK